MTLAELLGQYEEKYLPTTISVARGKSAIKHLVSELGQEDVGSIDYQKLVDYRSRRSVEVSAATVNRELAILGSAYRWAGISSPRIPRSREVPRPDAVDESAIQKLINAAHNLQTKAFTAMLFATGQRLAAVQTLRRSQIRGGIIEFSDDGYEKASRRKNRARTPVTPEIEGILKTLRKEFGDTEYVFPPAPGKPGYAKELPRWFRKAAQAAGVAVTPHVIRHSAATIALGKKATLFEVSSLLGHASTAFTERQYVKRRPEYLKATVSTLGGLVKI
jgi:integrase